MLNSLKTKITVPVIAVLTLLVIFIIVFVAVSLQNFANERSNERIRGASQAAHFYFERLEAYNRMAARAISASNTLIQSVETWNTEQARQTLLNYFNATKHNFSLSYIVVIDKNGYILLHTGDMYYTPVPPQIFTLMDYGDVITYYSSSDAVSMGLSSVSPIWDRNYNIIGAVTAIVNMGSINDNAFVDNFAEIFNASVTVFYGAVSVASTIYTAPGVRAVGTVADSDVAERVIMQGLTYFADTQLFGEPYEAYYFPLFGLHGNVVGMFFVGFSTAETVRATNYLLRSLIIIGFIVLVISGTTMMYIISASSNKVSRLANIVENMTSGNQKIDLSTLEASKDEVGVLTKNILVLVDTIKNLSDILSNITGENFDSIPEKQKIFQKSENASFFGGSHLENLSLLEYNNPIHAAMKNIIELKHLIVDKEQHIIEADSANRAKSEFLSAMSHEIRTPMNAILGIAEIQLQNPNITSEIKEALEKIYTSGDMLLNIINDILDLSKIEAGKMELIINKYEIASLISDTAQLNIMRIGSKPIKFEVYVDEAMPAYMRGDALRVKQILNNILSNAFKYTNEGSVKMHVSSEKNILKILVADTGQGMTKEQVNKLFDEYSRFNQEDNRSTEGTGLGMSITRNLIQMMDGRLEVKSEKGKGSTFTLYIPQEPEGIEKIGKETSENLSRFKTNSHLKRVQVIKEAMPYGKILIVDDVDTNIYVAKGLMAPYELQIDTSASGFGAIEKVEEGNVYDIIFMDHMMPHMDGIETTKRLRDMGYTAPIVALTANAIAGQADIFINNGFTDFISKPIDIRQLNLVLNRLVRDKEKKPGKKPEIETDTDSGYELEPEILSVVRKDFINSQSNVIAEIKQAIKNGEITTAQRIAHSLKGIGALINEHELVTIAEYTENLLKQAEIPDESILQAMETELNAVIERLTLTADA